MNKIKKNCFGKNNNFFGRTHSTETKEKMRLAKTGLTGDKANRYKGGKPNCLDCGKKLSNYNYKYCIKHRSIHFYETSKKGGLFGAKAKYDKYPISQEKVVYDFLLLKGIIFEKQKIIDNKMVVDVYIPSLKLVIEVDGKSHEMKRIKDSDMEKEKYLNKIGMNLLRITHEEIESGEFKERLVL